MNPEKIRICALAALMVCLLLSACTQREPSYEDRETFPPEVLTPVEGTELILQDGLTADTYPADSSVGAWLTGCGSSDRNDHFDAYTLRHEAAANGNTTFTYLIYYPHETGSLKAKPSLSESDSGYIVDLTYEAGEGTEGYSLCYLTLTLPTEKAPRLRLHGSEEILGVMSTVTANPIPNPAGA